MNFVDLGLRNIVKNGRRSLVTILAVAFGFAAISLFLGYITDAYAFLAEQAVHGERLGHLVVMRQGLLKQGKLDPLAYTLSAADVRELSAALAADPEVELVVPRLAISGLISNGKVSTIFIGEGIGAADLASLRGNFKLERGGLLDPRVADGAAVSSDLAEMLGLKQGDFGTLVTATLSGSTNAIDAGVQDVFNTGNIGTNDKYLIAPLGLAQQLMDTDGADRISVLLRDADATESARRRLEQKLAGFHLPLEIKTWVELSAFYTQVRNMFDIMFGFLFSIVVTIVMMSIVNTMSMTVVERTREIGTLRALGMRRSGVMALFCVEGALLAALGGLFGIVLTIVLALLINHAEIQYIPPNNTDKVPLVVAIVPSLMGLAFVFVGLLAGLAALLPARRAALSPVVDALGHA